MDNLKRLMIKETRKKIKDAQELINKLNSLKFGRLNPRFWIIEKQLIKLQKEISEEFKKYTIY